MDIKLIAMDLDGTLLTPAGNLPENFFEVAKALQEQGICLVAASGRSYPALQQMFSGCLNDFICDNGAVVVFENEIIGLELIKQEQVERILKDAEELEEIFILLCGKNGTYHLPCGEEFLPEISKYYVNRVVVEDLWRVQDEIFKIAICDLNTPAKNSYPYFSARFEEELSVQISGKLWLDFMKKGVDKGIALATMQKKMNITKKETMAFGDYHNDIPLLLQAEYSFAMENAHEDVKKISRNLAKSNQESGVILELQKLIR